MLIAKVLISVRKVSKYFLIYQIKTENLAEYSIIGLLVHRETVCCSSSMVVGRMTLLRQ